MSAPSVEGALTAPSAVAFARRGGVRLAFRTAGREGAPAAVLVPGFASHVDVLWDDAGPRAFHVHRTGDAITPVEHGRRLADHIPGARLCELPGADHLWWLPEPSAIADLITDFTEEHSR